MHVLALMLDLHIHLLYFDLLAAKEQQELELVVVDGQFGKNSDVEVVEWEPSCKAFERQ